MARKIKKDFKHGIWIKEWKFRSNKAPFNSKMTPAAILLTRHKIEKYALKTLKDRKKWKAIGEKFTHLVFHPIWKITTPKNKPMILDLKVEIINPIAPPRDSVVAPPPPPPPPGKF